MYRLSTILRLLLLIVLLGGLGVVQPTFVQQTVTLSRQVTDAAGQPLTGRSFTGTWSGPFSS